MHEQGSARCQNVPWMRRSAVCARSVMRSSLVGLRVRVRGQSGAIVSVEKDNRHARVAFVDSAGSDSTALVPVEGIVPCRENTLGGASEPAGGLVRTTTARGVEETARMFACDDPLFVGGSL